MHYYELSKQIIVSQGQHVIITGEKKTGKTRLLNVVESLFYKVVLIYSTNSKILGRLGDNFTVSNPNDFDLIRELAAGLKLLDLENLPDAQIEDWHMGDINTGDKKLLTVLIMLYMGIKELEKVRIMIFDEVLANIDDRNSKEILEFIIKKVDAISEVNPKMFTRKKE